MKLMKFVRLLYEEIVRANGVSQYRIYRIIPRVNFEFLRQWFFKCGSNYNILSYRASIEFTRNRCQYGIGPATRLLHCWRLSIFRTVESREKFYILLPHIPITNKISFIMNFMSLSILWKDYMCTMKFILVILFHIIPLLRYFSSNANVI